MAEQRSSRRKPASGAGDDAGPPREQVCPVAFCPVGLALTMAEGVRPEVVEHLMAAGRELLLAIKAVIDARAEGFERSSPLERITIE